LWKKKKNGFFHAIKKKCRVNNFLKNDYAVKKRMNNANPRVEKKQAKKKRLLYLEDFLGLYEKKSVLKNNQDHKSPMNENFNHFPHPSFHSL
jgi:hypothetical protein